MEYRFEKRDSFNIIGMNFYGDPFSTGGAWSVDNAIGKLWQRFGSYLYNKSDNITHRYDLKTSYEFHIMGDEFEDSGEYSIMIGVAINNVKEQPIDLVIKSIPSYEYLVLELRGQEIISDCMMQVNDLLKDREHIKLVNGFMFQKYDERFKGMDNLKDSMIEAYFPIKRIKV